MKVLFVQHSPSDPPGRLGELLLTRGGRFDVFHPVLSYADHAPLAVTALPPDDAGYDGLVILGGPMDADDDAHFPHYRALFALLGAFERAGKPVLGLCLGAQLVARHHGAWVRRMARKETGLAVVTLLPAAAADPLLAGLGPRPRLMEWHQDGFGVPDGATLLAAGEACPQQIVRVGALTYACQGHPEATLDTVRRWVYTERDALPPGERDELPAVVADMNTHWAEARAFADAFLGRWLDLMDDTQRGHAQ